ncbi:caspase family protein [Peptostreptococcaceae bacterium AGR-M142]
MKKITNSFIFILIFCLGFSNSFAKEDLQLSEEEIHEIYLQNLNSITEDKASRSLNYLDLNFDGYPLTKEDRGELNYDPILADELSFDSGIEGIITKEDMDYSTVNIQSYGKLKLYLICDNVNEVNLLLQNYKKESLNQSSIVNSNLGQIRYIEYNIEKLEELYPLVLSTDFTTELNYKIICEFEEMTEITDIDFEDEIYINLNDSHIINYELKPSNDTYHEIEYIVEDPSIIEIINNKIIPLKTGSTKVKGYCTPGICKDEFVVYVSTETKPTDFDFEKQNYKLDINDEFEPTILFTPSNSVVSDIEYSSSNTGILNIEDGKFQLLAPGKVSITGKSPSLGIEKTVDVYISINTNIPRRRTLIIANYDYPKNKDLDGPKYDAYAMRKTLNNSFNDDYGFETINTAENIGVDEVENLISENFNDATDNDVSYIYYSGHGSYNSQSEESALELVDEPLYASELKSYLDKIKGKKVIIIDACESGGFVSRDMNDSNDNFSVGFLKAFKETPSQIGSLVDFRDYPYKVITAASKTELSYEYSNHKPLENGMWYYGLFTRHLTEGSGFYEYNYPADLNNDDAVSLEELYEFTYNNVMKKAMESEDPQTVCVYPPNDSFVVFGKSSGISGKHVEDITCEQNSLFLDLGEEFELDANILPNDAQIKTLLYYSDDSNIAKVDPNGKIKANSIGQTKIHALSLDGFKEVVIDINVKNLNNISKWSTLASKDENKIWQITFNKNLDIDNLENIIAIYDFDDNKLDTTINISATKENTIEIRLNNTSYQNGKMYYMLIDKNLKSIDQENLSKDIFVPFSIK